MSDRLSIHMRSRATAAARRHERQRVTVAVALANGLGLRPVVRVAARVVKAREGAQA